MAMNEYEQLLRATASGFRSEVARDTGVRMPASLVEVAKESEPSSDMGRVAYEVEQLRRITTVQTEAVQQTAAAANAGAAPRKQTKPDLSPAQF